MRDATVAGPVVADAVLELRALRGRVTAADGLGIALRLRPASTPAGAHPWAGEHIDWGKVLPGLRFEVKTPAGATHVLEVADAPVGPPAGWALDAFVQSMTLDGAALAQGAARRPWRAPAAALLASPGTYSVTVAGTFVTDRRSLDLRSGPLRIEVVPASDAHRPLVDLERAASEIARATWGMQGIPLPVDPTIDDVGGALSVRFRRSAGPDHDLLEVWLAPSGATIGVDAYRHFACVAEGTPVATPAGPVAIEALVVGSEVVAFDVARGTTSVAIVERIERGHAESLRALGPLRVTAEHPVWADGSWQRAGDVTAGAMLLGLDRRPVRAAPVVLVAPTTVLDLTVTAPHTYFAGGILVHNKAQHVPLGGKRPWGRLFYRRAAKP